MEMAMLAWLKASAVILTTYGSAIGVVGTGGYWGLTYLIKHAVAEEKFATQEALDEQTEALKKLQEKFSEANQQLMLLQNDAGTVKQQNRDNREVLDKILLGISNIDN